MHMTPTVPLMTSTDRKGRLLLQSQVSTHVQSSHDTVYHFYTVFKRNGLSRFIIYIVKFRLVVVVTSTILTDLLVIV